MKTKYKILIGVVVLLIVVRLILPYVVLQYANKTLANMKGYYGHIENIQLSIYRGAYILNHMYLDKTDSSSKKQTPFIRSRTIALAVEWRALFHGSIVGKLDFDSTELVFTKDKVELGDVRKDTIGFRQLLKKFMPLKVNRFEVSNGTIRYIDNGSKPKVDVSLQHTHILASNLSNATNDKVELPTTVSANSLVYEGTLNFNMKLNALAVNPTFELNAEMKNTNLVLLNDFLEAYGKFDVNRGKFGLFTEMAAKNGKFVGYVKPEITDLKVTGPEDRKDTFFHKIWESLIGATGVVLKNQQKDQVATKIRMEGNFNNPHTNTLDAVWELLRNAFVQALTPSIDNEININSIKNAKPDKRNFIQKIFSPQKKNGIKENK